jgi:two-component system sensor histidine kinase ChiS
LFPLLPATSIFKGDMQVQEHAKDKPFAKPSILHLARMGKNKDSSQDRLGTEANFGDELLKEVSRLRRKQKHSLASLARTMHYLKSLVCVVEGYLKLFESKRLGPLTPRQSEALSEMAATVARLQQLSAEILTYSFWASNTAKLRFKVGEFQPCLEAVCREWKPAYDAKGVDLRFESSESIAPFPFDSEGVGRLVACLLDNALKFTPRGKSVRLTVEPHFWERRIKLDNPPWERRKSTTFVPNSALISVIDTGAGIPLEYQQEIFDEFYSAAAGDAKPGTGLGLAIARYVVQMHAGKIWVESSVGVGSRFCVLLPYSPQAKAGKEELR